MKKLLLLSLLVTVAFSLSAQHTEILNWKNRVDSTFVFEINNEEAERLLKEGGSDRLMGEILREPIAVFTDKWRDMPEQGHFIYANINRNKINFKYEPVVPFQVFLFREYGLLTLQVIDNKGEVRRDAKIKIQSGGWRLFDKRVSFDKVSQTYTIDDMSEKGKRILTVELDKFQAVFDLNKYFVGTWQSRYDDQSGPDFYSYMITDKNKYKPGESVRFKSYALTGSRRPIKNPLEVWMNTSGRYSYKKIAEVTPYNPGGFAGEVFLHDSLKLRLDNDYYLQLRDKSGKIVANTRFRYEDYVLYNNKMESQLFSTVHYCDTNYVDIKITDANGLIMPDMVSVVTITREKVLKSYQDLIVLPDIIRRDTLYLDNNGTTHYPIFSEWFGNANILYNVNVETITPDGKGHRESHRASFLRSNYSVRHKVADTTILFEFRDLGEVKPIDAQLYIDGADRPLSIRLPHTEPFNQRISGYRIFVPEHGINHHFNSSDAPHGLKIEGGIINDSLKLEMINPKGLEVSWYVYEGNMLLDKGFGKEMSFEATDISKDINYYLEIFYTMGDSEQVYRKVYSYRDKILNVETNLPDRVYPGQEISSTIKVTDIYGSGVKNVDVTAFSYNTLLGYHPPDLPYYGNTPKSREQRNSYSIDRKSAIYSTDLTWKNYAFWNKIAELDKRIYYRFTYPYPERWTERPNLAAGDLPFFHDIFKYTVDTPDGTTEFAPYVMQNGNRIEIYVIELDDLPVYFNWTNQPKGYSFLVDSEKRHKVTLRVHDRAIIIDNYRFEKGKKTIFSLDLDKAPKSRYVRMVWLSSNYFTQTEINRYRPYVSVLPTSTSRYTYLQNDSLLYVVHYSGLSKTSGNVTIGPLKEGHYRYMNGIDYFHEGGYSYRYSDNVVYKYSADLLPGNLRPTPNTTFYDLNDFHFTRKVFDRKVAELNRESKWFPGVIHLSNTKVVAPSDKERTGVHSLVMFNSETGKMFVPVHKGVIIGSARRDVLADNLFGMDGMEYGPYDLILLYNSGKYLRYNKVPLLKGSYTELNMDGSIENSKDSLSSELLKYEEYVEEMQDVQPPPEYGDSYLEYDQSIERRPFNPVNDIRGIVVDRSGEPLLGVYITIKGQQSAGTVSDVNGEFVLDLHGEESAVILVSYIGFRQQEISVTRGSTINIVLEEDEMMLDEVVVVAYGTSRRADITGAMAGISAGYASETRAPEEETEEDADEIENAESKLYQELLVISGLRTNFSDVGFWEPALVTDRKGEATFTTTLPDNITTWEAVIYAMNRRLMTGTARHSMQSYKPIMAELQTPSFLVTGDVSHLSANIRNYTKDSSIKGRVDFVNNGDTITSQIELNSSAQEYIEVIAPEADSAKYTYLFTRDDGYSDGERRAISIEKEGTEVAEGTLQILKDGDEIKVEASPNDMVYITISGEQIDIYMDVAYYLIGYKYACNEQLASKLIGLLNYRIYSQFMGEKFEHDKSVNEIISRLLKNQNNRKLWSWWGNSDSTSFWMSAHILRALSFAKKSGYIVNLNIRSIANDYTDIRPYRGSSLSDIEILSTLLDWGVEQKYEKAIDLFEEEIRIQEHKEDSLVNIYKKSKRYEDYAVKRSYLYEKLLLLEMRQKLGLSYSRELFDTHLQSDILGRVRIVDTLSKRSWYYNDDMSNLTAYRIVRSDSLLMHHKEAMQLSILSTRQYGWNTYQSASSLQTVMPDLISSGTTKGEPAKISLSGRDNTVLTEFPYSTVLSEGERLTIKKESGIPLIYSSYTIQRRKEERSGDAFEIKSDISAKSFKRGTPVTMSVEVTVKEDNAEHVMIEIPIPAGCSYNTKYKGYSNYEVYREYFKEKCVIFCEKLPKGKYIYKIDLMPRFTGEYTVNPAKAEMMYFPVINANNSIERIQVSQ